MELIIDGKTVLIDAEDWPRVKQHRWWLLDGEKPCATINGQRVYLHHYVMPRKPGLLTIHQDHNQLNCRKTNLKYGTRAQSCAHSRGRYNPSGYRGVSRSVVDGRTYYRVVVKSEYVGTYMDAEEAARAYDQKALEVYGEFAVLNFPPSSTQVQS